ncbi:MAG: AAA family ATPase [Opitutaceae bacterium]|jgi:hypothetical protein
MATKETLPTISQLREWITSGTENPKRFAYPQEAVEPTLGMLDYAHFCCDSNIEIVTEKCRAMSFTYDRQYYYQLLTGRYFRVDAEQKVQGSWRNLRELWTQVELRLTFARQISKVIFTETTVWETINEYVQRKRVSYTSCKFGAIVGYTGSQKSACFNELIRREEAGTIIRMEAPPIPSLSEFIHKLSDILGSAKSDGRAERRDFIRKHFKVPRRTLIVDNIQRCLCRSVKNGSYQPIFEFLLELQEDTGCTIIISWTPDADKFEEALKSAFFEQFIGRIGGEREILRLEEFTNDEDIRRFCGTFKVEPADIEELMPRLRTLVQEKGRVRPLIQALQAGHRLANAANKPYRAIHLRTYLAD